jgi:26S proteasome regulatory subunit T4
MKALQSVGQIIGEILKQLDDERCALCLGRMNHTDVYNLVIVKSSAGPRYVVSYRPAIPVSKVSYFCWSSNGA